MAFSLIFYPYETRFMIYKMPTRLSKLGANLTKARKRSYPKDTQATFCVRIGVSKATYSKMEKGDLSVSMDKYYSAAKLLELEDGFERLFEQEENILDV